MAYYDALISAWNGATQPPSGATGTGITAGMTTAQKIVAVNSWMIVGTTTYSTVNGTAVLNCIAQADWNAITDAQRSQVGTITGATGGVDPTPGSFAPVVLAGIFAGKTTTLNALTALQASAKKIASTSWCGQNGYPPQGIQINDANAAGLT